MSAPATRPHAVNWVQLTFVPPSDPPPSTWSSATVWTLSARPLLPPRRSSLSRWCGVWIAIGFLVVAIIVVAISVLLFHLGVRVAAIIISILVILVILGAALFIRWRKKKEATQARDHEHIVPPPHGPNVQDRPHGLASPEIQSPGSGVGNPLSSRSPRKALGFSLIEFSLEELARATDGFSKDKFLGQGGFGQVHRGVLSDGKEVAVKQLKAGSDQGDSEFQAEVEIISRVHHKHLVSLVGYCISGIQRMLVYEFLPNNTLEFHLHGRGRPTMDWPTRLKIALGAAKGLAYLHEDCNPKIIHRDIKAANILLDLDFVAKVADFGLAKFFPDANTHISTLVRGTRGYLDPEYAYSGKLTDKSDVFSFGVMLLEFITGRRPADSTQSSAEHNTLVVWARSLLTQALEDGNFDTLVDRRLQKDYNHNEMARMVACAAACVRHSAQRRPQMSQVVRALEGATSLSDLNNGITPGRSTVYGSYGISNYDAIQHNETTTQESANSAYATPSVSIS